MDTAKESRAQMDAWADATLLELNEQMAAAKIHNQTMFDGPRVDDGLHVLANIEK